MADTLAEAFGGGWKTGVDVQNYGEQQKAATELATAKAEMAKGAVAQAQEESTYSQLTKQAFLKAQEANVNLDAADTAQRITLYDKAIQDSKNNPEIQNRLYEQKQGLLKTQADQLRVQGEIRKQKQQADLEFVTTALTTPEVGGDTLLEKAKEENNPYYAMWGAQLKDQAPIAMFGRRKYSQLTPDEQDIYRSTIIRGMTPKGETTAHNLIQEQINWRRAEQAARTAEETNAIRAQAIAAKRDGQAGKDTSKLTIEANKEIQAHRKNIRTMEIEQAKIKELYGIEKDITEQEGLIFKSEKMPPAAQERYKLLTDQINEEKAGIAEQTSRLEAAGATPVPKGKTTEYSKEKPAKPTSKESFAALPSGTWFINPADGKLLQKK